MLDASATEFLIVLALATASVWFGFILQSFGTHGLGSPRVLDAFVWITVIAACGGVALGRLGYPQLQYAALSAGTVVVAAVLIAAILSQIGGGGRVWGPLSVLVCGYALVQVVSLVVNGGPFNSGTIPQIAGLVFLPGVVILTSTTPVSLEYVTRLVARVSTSVVFGSLVAMTSLPQAVYAGGASDIRRFPVPGVPERLAGLTPHPNLLGATAVICALSVIAAGLKFRHLTVAACVATLVLAEARVASISLVGIVAILWVMAGRDKPLRVMAVGVTGVAISPFAIAWLAGEQGLTEDAASVNGRVEIWNRVVEYWDDKPIFGWGPLSFQPNSGTPFSSHETGYLHAHQQMLQGLVEGGLLGLVFIAGVLVVIARQGLTNGTPLVLGLSIFALAQSATEVFLSLHLFGLNYSMVPGLLTLAVFAAANKYGAEPREVTDARRHSVGATRLTGDTGR